MPPDGTSSSTPDRALRAEVARVFRARFGSAPATLVAAPGRVNLIGEHVDYNDGLVLPLAIDRWVVAGAAPATTRPDAYELFSAALEESVVVTPGDLAAGGHEGWRAYVAGTLAECLAEGLRPEAFQASLVSTVPLGGGLSSSAALELAVATLAEHFSGRALDPVDKALVCHRAEQRHAGVPCGIMDQFCSALARPGHAMLLDCRSRVVEHVPLAAGEVSILVIDSRAHHELADGEYARRRIECEAAAARLGVASLRDATPAQVSAHRDALGDVLFRRARHVVTEIERVGRAADALRRGDWTSVGALMNESHDSLRDDYEVSCVELDLLVSLSRAAGNERVLGSRMTGGGFGGCTVSLVRPEAAADVARDVSEAYERETGLRAAAFVVRPVGGASVLDA